MTNAHARVVHVITGLGDGGAEGALTRLVLAERPNAPEPCVISLTGGGRYADVLTDAGVEVVTLNMRRGRPSLTALSALRRQLRRVAPVAVQSWMYHADLMTSLAARGMRETRVYWGIRCSDMDAAHYGLGLKLTRKLCAFLSSWPDAVVANSFAGQRVHADMGYRPRDFVVVANGIDSDRFAPNSEARARIRAELNVPTSQRVVVTLARNDPMKGYVTLLEVAKSLPDLCFLLAGTGTETLAGLPNVRALGQRDDVEDITAAGDFIVSSSWFGEGFSNSIAEGMAAGLYPVVTDVGDARVIVGDSGDVVAPRSAEALTEALEAAGRRGDFSARTTAARKRIVDMFAVERMVSAFDALHVRGELPGALS
tara:strand:- start:1517 stop:2623 length:1107 start_codon:yes stop_codon:yes gene_type:complete